MAGRESPNEGVTELAGALLGQSASPSQAAQNYAQATTKAQRTAAAGPLVDDLAKDPSVAKLQLFAGYLGGVIQQQSGPTQGSWQLLYLDPKLRSWLLINVDSFLFRKKVTDATSAFGSYDYVWLASDASVSQGEGPVQDTDIQARFLRGAFVSAGDFAASVSGGTFAPPTGPACPLTPGCCGIRTK